MRVTHLVYILLLFPITVQSQLYAKVLYSHQQAIQILDQEKISAALTEFVTLKSTITGSDTITAWIDDPSLEPLLKEKLLYDVTLIVRNRNDDLYRSAMNKLVNYQVDAYLPLGDAGRIIEIPAFQVAASAKATLLHWDIALYGYVKTINEAQNTQLIAITNIIKLNPTKLPVKALLSIADKSIT